MSCDVAQHLERKDLPNSKIAELRFGMFDCSVQQNVARLDVPMKHSGVVRGMTITAEMPRVRAARATPCA